MAGRDNLHSRVVAWLKVILPLTALGLLSTLFLVARTGDPDASLPFSEADLQEMAREQRVEGPEFSGLTEEGRAISFKAGSAIPRDSRAKVVDAFALLGHVETGDGSAIRLSADEGTVFSTQSRAALRGNVQVVTTTGYTVQTDALNTALNRTDMDTPGPVTADGPVGRVDAGRMVVTQTGTERDDVSVVFKNGVKLIYVPNNQ